MKFTRIAASAVLVSALSASTAFAVNKDMVQLQTQVQALQDAVARLQQANDERMGVLKDLVQQTADSVNRMAVNVDGLQRKMATQAEAQNSKTDQISGQVQSLNDSLDELKARLGRLEKAMGDVQSQQSSISAKLDSTLPATGMPPTGGSALPDAQPLTPGPTVTPPPPTRKGGKPSAAIPSTLTPDASTSPAPATAPIADTAPPVDDLYQTAYGDYVAAKFQLAAAEFSRVIKFYPDHNLAGNSNFYLGEMDYRAGKFSSAAKFYDKVLEQYPGNNKIPLAQLHKGYALIAMRQDAAGARELRSLVQRYPNSPEANQARVKLNSLNARR